MEIINYDYKINEKDYKKFLSRWLRGIEHELEFWESIMNGSNKLYKWNNSCIKQTTSIDDPNIIKILDVGSGPISLLSPSNNKHIIACDPLAIYYNSLLKKYNKEVPIKIEFCFSERLYEKYEEDFFDEVHMSNSLDHCFFPMISIFNLLYIVKVGGKVILKHNQNEAEYAQYTDFHQFNIDIQNDKAVLWNKDTKIILETILYNIADIKSYFTEIKNNKRLSVTIEITKKRNFNILEYISVNHYFDKYMFIAISQLVSKYGNILDNVYNMVNLDDNIKSSISDKIDKVDHKINKIIDTLAWWIPFKKKREEFRAKFR